MTRPSFFAFFSFLVAVFAAPSPDERTIVVGVSSVRSSSNLYLAARDKATSELLASSGSNSLSTGAFTISADVDKTTGAGNLIIGGKTYIIHEDPAVSGGITCESRSKCSTIFLGHNVGHQHLMLRSHVVSGGTDPDHHRVEAIQ